MPPNEKETGNNKRLSQKSFKNNRQEFVPKFSKMKRKWVPLENKFVGSVKEGKGFAFKRKEKIQYEYKKLLQKEKRNKSQKEPQYMDIYPEHLKHLYLAEEEKIKDEEQKRNQKRNKPVEITSNDQTTPNVSETPSTFTDLIKSPYKRQKKFQNQSSYQKTQEEYKRIQEERNKKRQEADMKRQQKEEAQQKYKQKRLEAYQILSKKTKKGQPNLNLRMEYLLQKIQESHSK
ncbi:thyroid transcription factor 1-associated protein 26 homolog [Polypterus senegalus]|uniref:thyroid transcription factor 1-associated protein 26 homolog n=1 Tax=Polypterus senegalus TaxID=55291 RepID=UPI001963BFBF|nr:thyroid transcription factor 1-associated protein 26 homolog [Polypterus senegalus]